MKHKYEHPEDICKRIKRPFDTRLMTVEQIRRIMEQYEYDRNNDPNIPCDISIVAGPRLDSDEYYFAAHFHNQKNSMRTGRGGLKLLLQQGIPFALLKVQYNGEVLTTEQKEEMYKEIMNSK